jgi:1,4-dihydroxy-2-naphthoyl-CoA hydrolase
MPASVSELDDIANTGHNRQLGLTVTGYEPDTGVLSAVWELPAHVLGVAGSLHHGAISSVVETIASIGAGADIDEGQTVVGVSNSTDCINATWRSPLRVTGVRVSGGRDQQLWEVRVVDSDDDLVARGTVRLQHITM